MAEAKASLPELIERAANGEEIILARAGKPRAKLVPSAPTRSGSVFPGRGPAASASSEASTRPCRTRFSRSSKDPEVHLLLDTHTFLWWDDDKLPRGVVRRIQAAREVYVSAASAWEVAIPRITGIRSIECSSHKPGSKA